MARQKKCPNCGRHRAREQGFFTKSLRCSYCGASSTLKKREVKKKGIFFQRVVSVREIYDSKGGERWKRNWREARAAALERAGYKCSKCGSHNDLHVHHIKPVSKGGTDALSNLAVLCADCHRAVHKRTSNGLVIIIIVLGICASLGS
jgi:DNA-directed RNA polymerase subunit RPC12/RpoP